MANNKEEIVLTNFEHRKWVTEPNVRHNWSFSKESMLRLFNDYQKEKCPRRRKGYVERLIDANFHSLATALEDGDNEEFMAILAERFK